ncbi:MAG: alpha-xylosidase [Armatimonadetes bacterium]|nr:alpha-xylosidase [Armatimonadota bacterium]
MKFTDGNWLHREGVTPHYAAEANRIQVFPDRVEILVPCHAIRHRGDTLAGPALTVTLRAPRENVIAVKAEHFRGVSDSGPHFNLYEEQGHFQVSQFEDRLEISSGGLKAIVRKNPWTLEFEFNGRSLTTSPCRGLAMMELEPGGKHLMAKLGLGVGECVYGLGERFTAFVKNGQTVDIWNEDGGTNSEQAYKNIPFYMTNQGYGVLVNSSGKVSFEVGSERTNLVQFSVPGESLEYMVIAGPGPKEVLMRYTDLTGKPALPPQWSFGLWLSTSFTTSYDEATVNEFIQGMADRDIPLSVFHYDCFWMREMHWCDFEWDPAVFPDPPSMLNRLHQKGLKVCVWINPYIAQASALFQEGLEHGYLLRKPNGDVWQWDMWQPGMALVDFTNPNAKKWFQSKLAALIDQGVDALKTDFGERIPTDVAYFDGSDPERMHNFYTYLYNQAVFEVLEEKRGKGEAVLFARSATVGGQKFPVHWGGDCWSTFEAMAESLRGGLSLGMSGFGFWSHDIGGFEGLPPAHLYKRWVAFGLLSSHSRLHGSASYRVPWVYDDEAVDVLRFFVKLKNRLMPYLWAVANDAHEQGLPMMRAMHLEFPHDPTCDVVDRQYMLGDSLLVAPVFTESGEVTFYVPEGRWTSLIDRSVVEGPRWVKQTHGPLSLPLLVRPNSIIPMGQDTDCNYDPRDTVTVEWFEPAESAEFNLRGPAGETKRVTGRLDAGTPVIQID